MLPIFPFLTAEVRTRQIPQDLPFPLAPAARETFVLETKAECTFSGFSYNGSTSSLFREDRRLPKGSSVDPSVFLCTEPALKLNRTRLTYLGKLREPDTFLKSHSLHPAHWYLSEPPTTIPSTASVHFLLALLEPESDLPMKIQAFLKQYSLLFPSAAAYKDGA